jgi:hypothetical protein
MNKSKALLSLTALLALFSFWINYTHHVSLLGGGDEGSYIACGKLMSERLGFIYDDHVAEFGKKYVAASNFAVTAFRVHNEVSTPVQMVSGWNKGFSFLTIPFWWLDQDGGWKYLNPLAGALSLIIIFLIGTRLKGAFVGFSAALLLATNFLQIWFSRYPMTEVVSQCLLLAMSLCVIGYYQNARQAWLWLFGLLSSVALFLHFGNAPLWLVLAAVVCLSAAPVERAAASGVQLARNSLSFIKELSFAQAKLKNFISAVVLTGIVPAVVAVGYWFLDPGIQRYTKLGKKMADSTGQLEKLLTALIVRIENLALFIPFPVWILLSIGLFLVFREKPAVRRLWLILVALAVTSFLVIVFTGVGTPRVLYVARRNVPMVLPVMFLICGLALDWLASRFQKATMRRVVVSAVLACIVGLQLVAFAPFATVDQGKGMPELANRVRAELASNSAGAPQLVIVPEVAASFEGGMRYVYGIPVVTYSPALTSEVIGKMLEDGVSLYVMDIGRTLVEPLKRNPDIKLSFVTSRNLMWAHINPIGPTQFPAITDRITSRVDLYKIARKTNQSPNPERQP